MDCGEYKNDYGFFLYVVGFYGDSLLDECGLDFSMYVGFFLRNE